MRAISKYSRLLAYQRMLCTTQWRSQGGGAWPPPQSKREKIFLHTLIIGLPNYRPSGIVQRVTQPLRITPTSRCQVSHSPTPSRLGVDRTELTDNDGSSSGSLSHVLCCRCCVTLSSLLCHLLSRVGLPSIPVPRSKETDLPVGLLQHSH